MKSSREYRLEPGIGSRTAQLLMMKGYLEAITHKEDGLVRRARIRMDRMEDLHYELQGTNLTLVPMEKDGGN